MEKGNISALTVGRIGAWTDALGLHAHGPPCGYIKDHAKLFFFFGFHAKLFWRHIWKETNRGSSA
jgi:hypothetical protein